ncbi:MAG: flagellar protein FlaG [Schwartzia sp.]|nr:flagellar protein FlaG [Schwartzia sp. (in: firmicutes)]
MIGKTQDLMSAAVVFSAVDSASRGATEAKQQQVSSDVASSQQATPPPTMDAPVKAGGESQQLGANNQGEDVRRAQQQAQEQAKMDEKSVDLMTKELNELMDKIDCNLAFKYNKDVDVMTVKMIDKETKEVLKEFPPEEMVKSMVKTKEWIGAFLDEHA